uniref:Uncharacterized protein n=1 Tax=Knipowitschia caucasica TaxID=637954 RepID=A0AAV2LUZ4_KNICA
MFCVGVSHASRGLDVLTASSSDPEPGPSKDVLQPELRDRSRRHAPLDSAEDGNVSLPTAPPVVTKSMSL